MASLKAGHAKQCVEVSDDERYKMEQQAFAYMSNAEVAEQFASRLPPSKEHDDAMKQIDQMRRMANFVAAVHGLPLSRCSFGDHVKPPAIEAASAASANTN